VTLPDVADILVIDDDPAEVELLLRSLEELCPRESIAVARDGEEALDYLLARGPFRHRAAQPLPRFVLLEFKLPRVDGLDVLRAIRTSPRASTVPVVMLTSSADPREVEQCYHWGANSCVQKPVVFGAFRSTLQELGRYWLGVNRTVPASSSPS
jgi:two-component system response regulator